jgi:hypothetical protein
MGGEGREMDRPLDLFSPFLEETPPFVPTKGEDEDTPQYKG